MAATDRTHYNVLGISPDADAAAVHRAWRKLVQVWHPDRFTEDAKRADAQVRASRINEAYTTLRDSSRRAAYDCRLVAEQMDARRAADAARTSSSPRGTSARPGATFGARGSTCGDARPAAAAPRLTLEEQFRCAIVEAWAAMRRHPRLVALGLSACLAVFGGSAVMHVVNGPSMPAGAGVQTAAAAKLPSADGGGAAAQVADDDQLESLDELADEAREDAERQQAELTEMLRADQEAQARADAAADAAAAPRVAPRGGPRGRIVRVMPSVPG